MKAKEEHPLKRIYKSVEGTAARSVILFVLQTLISVSMICVALILRMLVNSASENDISAFNSSIILLIAVIIVRILVSSLLRFADEKFNAKTENSLRSFLFSEILHRNYKDVSSVHNAEWMSRITTDTKTVASGITEVLPGFAAVAVKIIAAIAALVMIDRTFVLLVTISLIVLITASYFSGKKLKLFHKEIREKDGKSRIFLQERIENLIIVKSFNSEKTSENGLSMLLDDFKLSRIKRAKISVLNNTVFNLVAFGLYIFGAVSCGYGIYKGDMSYGDFTAVIALISQFISPLGTVSSYIPKYYSVCAGAKRLFVADMFAEDLTDNIYDITQIEKLYQSLKNISVNNVSFSYDSKINVFDSLSLLIEKNEFIALCGPSGCGKSTLLKLLLTLLEPECGNIKLEFENKTEALSSLYRKMFAYVPQGNMIISGSIKDIISMSPDTDYSVDEIKEALRISCSDAFVDKLSNGIDTVIGDNGVELSYGEMQRLSIARAILSKRPILLLDEVTSALDACTEQKVLQNIKSLSNKTVILVSHRKDAVNMCDRTINI